MRGVVIIILEGVRGGANLPGWACIQRKIAKTPQFRHLCFISISISLEANGN